MLARTTAFFASKGSGSPRLDAELLISRALGLQRIELYTQHDRPVTGAERDEARALVARRGRREPVAYILGTRAFRGLELAVGPGVLVPRPETELLVEWVVAHAPPGAAVLDWGTGSGAIALSLAAERPDLAVAACDVSPDALDAARVNGSAVGGDVEWVLSDGFAALAGRRFGVVVANPPYLSDAELEAAPRELAFEPALALAAGPRGDEAIAAICRDAPGHLDPRGLLITEIGEAQADGARALMEGAGFRDVAVHADLAGLPRAVSGRLP
ncbi:MAG: peptide chain release factor N(5)-glutamine methyltransferase [Thermoleophilia bacterium]|nr:peptide chain release factor N(5)-glutamine methyltransferase [Thermoleophilia bacterium]